MIEIDLTNLEKAKKRVSVKGTATRKAHFRMIEEAKTVPKSQVFTVKMAYDPNKTSEASAMPTYHDIGIAIGDKFFDLEPSHQKWIIAHETGHLFEDRIPGLNEELVGEGAKTLGTMVDTEKWLYFDGIYGESSPSEAFATGVAELYFSPEEFKSRYPKAYDFVSGVLPDNWEDIIKSHISKIPDVKKEYDKLNT